jgi:CelD/BcsL family acetyltransferase involved in cellulose biosynthesis
MKQAAIPIEFAGTAETPGFEQPQLPVARVELREGGVRLIEELAEDWRELCSESSTDLPFYRPEWFAAHIRAFEPHAKVALFTLRRGNRLDAVIPLIRDTATFYGLRYRRLRSVTNVHSCRFELVTRANTNQRENLALMWDAIQDLDWDVFVAEYVPDKGCLVGLTRSLGNSSVRAVQEQLWSSPYLSLEPSDAQHSSWLARVASANLGREVRRITKKLENQGSKLLRIDAFDQKAMDAFFEIEASGWKGSRGTAIIQQSATKQFYTEIASQAARFGYLSLYFMEHQSKKIATHLGLYYNHVYYLPKCGYDESQKSLSPGHVLVNLVLRDRVTAGMREFDFCPPLSEWKQRWTSEAHGLSSVYVFRGGYGRFLHRLRYGVRPLLKSMWTKAPRPRERVRK